LPHWLNLNKGFGEVSVLSVYSKGGVPKPVLFGEVPVLGQYRHMLLGS